MPPVTLIYHDIVPRADRPGTGFTGPGPDHYKIAPELFLAHLDAAGDARLTFDDGGASALVATAPLLEGRGRRGAFFVVTDRIGTDGFLDEDGLRELRARGHAIGSHGRSHRALTKLDERELADELRGSRQRLEEILGEEMTSLAVPGGFYDARIARAAAAAGYVDIYTSEPWVSARRVGSIQVHPRFSVVEDTPVEVVAALARRDRGTMLRARAGWEARKLARRAAGPVYTRLRARVLSRR